MTSDAGQRAGKSLARGFTLAVLTQVAYLAESRVCMAAEPNKRFLRSFEGGQHDCGLFMGPMALEGNLTDRVFGFARTPGLEEAYARKPALKDGIIIPMDIKNPGPIGDHQGNVSWRYDLTEAQSEKCQAIIFTSPVDAKCMETYRPAWTLHPLPAFPPELAPFMLPMTQLPKALDDMIAYAMGTTDAWINHYTGVVFDVPRLQAYPFSVMAPQHKGWITALSMVQVMYDAFKTCSQEFRVEMCDIVPVTGDFKIVHIATGTETLVEAKKGHCQFRLDGREVTALRHDRYAMQFEGKEIFDWKATWDYIFTSSRANGKEENDALFLPRDRIPINWWNTQSSETSHTWSSLRMQELRKYYVNLRSPESVVTAVEDIIKGQERQTGSIKAQRVIPLPKRPSGAGALLDTDESADVVELGHIKHLWSTSMFRRGFGSTFHGSMRGGTPELWMAEALTEVCRKWGNGLVLDFGKRNTMGRFFVARYPWTRKEQEHYDRHGEPPRRSWHVEKDVPLVRVAFMTLGSMDDLYPKARSAASYLVNCLLFYREPCIIVCDLFPYTSVRQPHGRFIFPSDHLPSKFVNYKSVKLSSGLLDQWYVDEADIMKVITSLATGKEEVLMGFTRMSVTASSYRCSTRDALKAGITNYALPVHTFD